MRKNVIVLTAVLLILSTFPAFSPITADMASADVIRLRGQTVYVPVYSHIYFGRKEAQFSLTVTLSIRNTDPANSITLTSVDYFDSGGKVLKKYLGEELKLNPMATVEYIVSEADQSGGAGANFIVKWKSDVQATAPIIETVMIGTLAQQGISFTSRGQPIDEAK